MFCSLFGLSPIDIILLKIEPATIRGLLGLLNNRFDLDKLVSVKSELLYFNELLTTGPVFDYTDRENRILSKKLNVSGMTAFGSSAEEIKMQLSGAPKSFSGNFCTKDKGTIQVSNEGARNIIATLHQSVDYLQKLIDSIVIGEFHDERFFGKSLSELASAKNALFLYYMVSDRLNNNDDIEKLQSDAIALSNYANDSGVTSSGGFTLPTIKDLEPFYSAMSGKNFDSRQISLLGTLMHVIGSIDLSQVLPVRIKSLFDAIIYCFVSEDRYNEDIASALDKCGLYGLNTVKADMLLNMLSSISFVSEGRAKFNTDPDSLESYPAVLTTIKKITENKLTPIGPLREEII